MKSEVARGLPNTALRRNESSIGVTNEFYERTLDSSKTKKLNEI